MRSWFVGSNHHSSSPCIQTLAVENASRPASSFARATSMSSPEALGLTVQNASPRASVVAEHAEPTRFVSVVES
jgi:hypothetical protein